VNWGHSQTSAEGALSCQMAQVMHPDFVTALGAP